MPLLRYWSHEPRWLGFHYGAPIHRATATFTIEDLKTALFGEEELTFTTAVARTPVRVHVTAVRECLYTRNVDSVRADVFGYTGDESYWAVDGFLSVLHSDGDHTFAMAETYEPGYNSRDRQEEEDMFLKVLAVVGFSGEETFVGAIVQRLPSPAD